MTTKSKIAQLAAAAEVACSTLMYAMQSYYDAQPEPWRTAAPGGRWRVLMDEAEDAMSSCEGIAASMRGEG